MISKEILEALEKDGAIEKKKPSLDIGQESINLKMDQVLAHNKHIEASNTARRK